MDLKQSDELIVCDECDTLCIHGDCPDHGPLEWIDDLEQPSGQHKSKARGSLPSFLYLMPSAAGQGRLGVFTRTRIEKRVMFGPFKGLKVPVENFTVGEQKTTMYMWDVLKDGKVQHIVDATDEQTSNWTRFVNCAHSDTEQNLVAVQFRGELYYKTCKAIECGSELLVWYNNSCTKAMDNAEQQEKSGWDFVCDCCRLAFAGSTFLLRHKALRCPATSGASDNSLDEIDVVEPAEPAGTDSSSTQDNYAPADEETYVVVNIPLISQPAVSESANSRRKKIVSKSHKRPLVAAKKGSSSGKRFKLKRSVGAAKKTRAPAGKSRSSQARSTSSSRGRKSQSLAKRTKRTSSTKNTVAAGKSKKSETGRRNASKVRKSSEAACSKSQTSPKKARKSSSAGKAKASKSRKVSSGDNEATAPTTDDETMSSGSAETSATPRRAKRSKVTGIEGAPKKKRGKPAVVKVPKEKPTYMCETCGKTFKWKSSLDYHVRSHASEKAFKCTICDKGLSQLSSLKRHLLMHSGEKPFKCDACGRGFLERGKLAWHQRLAHSGEVMVMEKKYKCPQCQWCFALSANLRSHMRTHTGERPFPCPQCGKCFKRSPDVVSHLRSHTGERPYKCSHCGKGFTMLSHRNRHEMIHTGAKPFKCSLCDKSFNQKVSVAAHEKVHARKQARLEKAGTDQQTDDPAEESLS